MTLGSAPDLGRVAGPFRRVLRTPPGTAARIVGHLGVRWLRRRLRRPLDRRAATYASHDPGRLASGLMDPGGQADWPTPRGLSERAEHYVDHRFDILGSGWVRVSHDLRPRGLEGNRYRVVAPTPDPEGGWLRSRVTPANLGRATEIWSGLEPGYVPIDWHRDFKSGYRWRETTWCWDVRVAPRRGVDIKVPWELARLQHLPQLALAAARAPAATRRRYVGEFQCQVLDFLATNPPRFGVNWRCPMDVAIRIANLLVAYDLFRAIGETFDAGFERLVARATFEHGRFVRRNLEGVPGARANHYLANLAGLVFAGAYLPDSDRASEWLRFAKRELVREVERQFHPDGSNFEASTCYHRLSAEMVVYSTALLMRVGKARGEPSLGSFPEWYLERIERMAEFTMYLTKPDGRMPQIGDNDSGRFLKLDASWEPLSVDEARERYANLEGYDGLASDDIYWIEDGLDHRHLVASINGLFRRDDFARFAPDTVETSLVAALAAERIPSYRRSPEAWMPAGARIRGEEPHDTSPTDRREFDVPGGGAGEGLSSFAWPDFGLFLLVSERVRVLVRCGPIGQGGNGGHAHLDQLATEIHVDGEPRVVDPGTYLYTPLPEKRNLYRSHSAHFAPRYVPDETLLLDMGLFTLRGAPGGRCLRFDSDGFEGAIGDGRVRLSVAVESDRIIVISRGASLPSEWTALPESPAYGVVRR